MRPHAFAASTVLLATSALARDVRVVDGAGGAQFTQIQPAIDASSSGDVVLIRGGTYTGFEIVDKSLVVLGDAVGNVNVAGTMRLLSMAASRNVVLQNLHVVGEYVPDTSQRSALLVDDCAGHIRVQSCSLEGAFVSDWWVTICSEAPNCYAAVWLRYASDVAFSSCTILGGGPALAQHGGAPGLYARYSRVTLHDSALQGREGQNGYSCAGDSGGQGGDGLYAWASTFSIAESTFQGGAGGRSGGCGSIFGCPYGGDGGDGIELVPFTTGSVAELMNVTTAGGIGGPVGTDYCGDCCGSGSPGHPRRGSLFVDLPGTSRSMFVSSPAREGATTLVQAYGTPGDAVGLLVSATPVVPSTSSRWSGFLAIEVEQPPRVKFLGTIPSTGMLTVALQLPMLPPSTSAAVHYLQAIFFRGNELPHVASPSTLVILDQAY